MAIPIQLDRASKLPPYEQVRSQFAKHIVAGTLPVGTKLPTVRQLAVDLAVAPNTIARAYRELETAGLIETRGRGGCVVTAAGDKGREQAHAAAVEYAAAVRNLGIDPDEAVAIVAAALGADGTSG